MADRLRSAERLSPSLLRRAKQTGFSDLQIARLRGSREDVIRGVRHALGIRPVF